MQEIALALMFTDYNCDLTSNRTDISQMSSPPLLIYHTVTVFSWTAKGLPVEPQK